MDRPGEHDEGLKDSAAVLVADQGAPVHQPGVGASSASDGPRNPVDVPRPALPGKRRHRGSQALAHRFGSRRVRKRVDQAGGRRRVWDHRRAASPLQSGHLAARPPMHEPAGWRAGLPRGPALGGGVCGAPPGLAVRDVPGRHLPAGTVRQRLVLDLPVGEVLRRQGRDAVPELPARLGDAAMGPPARGLDGVQVLPGGDRAVAGQGLVRGLPREHVQGGIVVRSMLRGDVVQGGERLAGGVSDKAVGHCGKGLAYDGVGAPGPLVAPRLGALGAHPRRALGGRLHRRHHVRGPPRPKAALGAGLGRVAWHGPPLARRPRLPGGVSRPHVAQARLQGR
mmetsp:Transcript_79765/g.243890  ORF Transcript_79765/g.243890 Transcript_79765/m.243890 type:complete len:338 (+) Transcript_79765:704-1717(+)